MSNRRAPLANNPNAANSPYRAVAAAAQKRSREQTDAQEDLSHEQLPLAKRQAVEADRLTLRTPTTRHALQHSEGRLFNKRPTNGQPTAFERRLLASKGKQVEPKDEIQEKANESLDNIRQWQKHYRKVFPCFVFYFESIPDDVRAKFSKAIRALGAREEKFFSKEVTHVVTTRVVPAESGAKSPIETIVPPTTAAGLRNAGQSRTINPSLLERQFEAQYQSHSQQPKNKSTFEPAAGRKTTLGGVREVEQRRHNGSSADILSKAREMGMKIWQLEKLQRVTNTMLEAPTESQAQHGHNTRSNMPVKTSSNIQGRNGDLSHMLRNERLNGPSDLDSTVTTGELVPFKGPYIYIRDMDEKTKPILVREYPKPQHKEDGEWPQFRSASQGKCPFVDDGRQELERAKAREQELLARTKAETQRAPRTRAAAAAETCKPEPIRIVTRKQPLSETKNGVNPMLPTPEKLLTKGICPPPATTNIKTSNSNMEYKHNPTTGPPRLFGGEPAASGLQASNITSAIRSQMISSTAAAPGAKAGISKEVHGLKRKVLEKNSGPVLSNMQASQRTADSTVAAKAERKMPVVRQTRRKTQEMLVHIDEESTQSEEEEDIWTAEEVQRSEVVLSKHTVVKDPKPGYCENCREKYDDFDQHIIGRKHRKFALTTDNWKDLDRLLGQLGRHLKEFSSDDF